MMTLVKELRLVTSLPYVCYGGKGKSIERGKSVGVDVKVSEESVACYIIMSLSCSVRERGREGV